MEAPAYYGSSAVRPRLTVVRDGCSDGPFSALPHAVVRRTDVSRDARLLVAVLQMYGWQGTDITASHATLAADMGCSTRMLRQYLDELIRAGIITEHEAGSRRQKVYRVVSIGSTVPIETVNENPASDSEAVNRKFSTVQSEVFDTSNRKQGSDSKKKTPEKKTKEETPDSSGEVVQGLFDYYRQKIQPGVRLNAPEKIRARLKKFTVAELKAGIDHFAADPWWMENNGARGAAWFFDSDRRSEQFLNLTPRPAPQSPARNGSALSANTPARPMGKPATNVRTYHVGGKPDA